jgi:hypothetical protein
MNMKLKKLVAGVLFLLGTSTAIAGLSHETQWTYFDKNGNEVGGRLFTCSGKMYTYGITTVNFSMVRDRCM